PSRDFHQLGSYGIQADGARQQGTERLQVSQSRQPSALRLEDVAAGFAGPGQSQASIGFTHHGDLVLCTCKRYPARGGKCCPPALADVLPQGAQQRLECRFLLRNAVAAFPDADGARALTPDRSQQCKVIACWNPQPTLDRLSHQVLGQQVAEPVPGRSALVCLGPQWHGHRQRNGLPACEVGRVVLEAPILRTAQHPGDVQGAGKHIEKPDGQLVARLAHEITARRRPSAASTASTLSSATLGLPRSKSPTN